MRVAGDYWALIGRFAGAFAWEGDVLEIGGTAVEGVTFVLTGSDRRPMY